MEYRSIREFAKRYRDLAGSPAQVKKRAAWAELNSLRPRPPLIYVRAIPYGEFFDGRVVGATLPILRALETRLAQDVLFRQTLDDDYIFEPWVTVQAAYTTPDHLRWGLPCDLGEKPMEGGAAAYAPTLRSWEDLDRLTPMPDEIDEAATHHEAEIVGEALNDILDVHVCRQAALTRMWRIDLSTDLAKLRGLERVMWDVYDEPELLHAILTRMQAAVLRAIGTTEAQGRYTLADHQNQAMPYSLELAPPDARKTAVSARALWGFLSSQEFTGVGPAQFDAFMLSYQQPIMERFGLCSYGCCEDLTDKIGLLRRIRNLRRIAVSPFADVRRCAEQIGPDYVISYRPDPSRMISRGLDEDDVRRVMREAFDTLKEHGCIFDITLKDVETISGKPENMIRWVSIVREEIARAF